MNRITLVFKVLTNVNALTVYIIAVHVKDVHIYPWLLCKTRKINLHLLFLFRIETYKLISVPIYQVLFIFITLSG